MMTNILMLTPYLPYPPFSGGRMRTYNLIKLLREEFNITLICFGRPEEQAFDLQPLHDLCETYIIDRAPSPSTKQAAILSLTSLQPVTMRLYRSEAFKAKVRELLSTRQYDVIHVESFYMLQNLPANPPVPVILAEPAIEYIAWWRHAQVAQPLYQRPAIVLEALKMRFFEPIAWGQVTLVGAMSEIDAAEIRKVTPGVKAFLSPNGVDQDYFQPADVKREAAVGLYMGDYKYFPNVDAVHYFVEDIFPLIRKERPDFRLVLLGKDLPPELAALGDDAVHSGVQVVGLVDDTRPYLQQATLFACSLRSGSGTRFKLLEALACGCPVVSTSLGAEGLRAEHGKHMLLADTPADFAKAVLHLLAYPAEARQIGRQGRQWVVQQHSWRHSANLLAQAYLHLSGSEDLTLSTRPE